MTFGFVVFVILTIVFGVFAVMGLSDLKDNLWFFLVCSMIALFCVGGASGMHNVEAQRLADARESERLYEEQHQQHIFDYREWGREQKRIEKKRNRQEYLAALDSNMLIVTNHKFELVKIELRKGPELTAQFTSDGKLTGKFLQKSSGFGLGILQLMFLPVPGLGGGYASGESNGALTGEQHAQGKVDMRDHYYYKVVARDPNDGMTHIILFPEQKLKTLENNSRKKDWVSFVPLEITNTADEKVCGKKYFELWVKGKYQEYLLYCLDYVVADTRKTIVL